MSDKDRFRRFVVRGEEMPGKLELLLDGIRFMREELGDSPTGLPESLEAAELEYSELISRVEPPTVGQLSNVSYLLRKTGGIMTGEVHSRRHAEILIEELRRQLTEQRRKPKVEQHRGSRGRGPMLASGESGERGKWLEPVVAAGIIVPWAACLFLWFETTIAWTVVALGLLFVVGGGLYVLGLWRRIG